ncbi:MAG: D-glycero-beta-D-manno-heptose-7-phosphate kinase [Rhodospirillales bacterium]|nr:D-glycero-beta-D-manno-heptose-7-phosphate kinase [Rhodospirillales bacterium]
MTQDSLLAGRIDTLKDAPVLCVGDVMLDRFVYGEVERISPEAPIPVMRIRRETAMLGGAGNVARNLAALGARPAFVSVVGDDVAGREVAGLLAAQPGAEPQVIVEADRLTTIKTRYLAASQQLLRADLETAAQIAAAAEAELLARARALLPAVRALVLSDYGKGVLTPAVIRGLLDAAAAAGVPSVVDPKGRDYTIYRGAGLLTPNRKELAEATGLPVGDDAAIVAAARHLIETCGVSAVLATRSQDGMTLVTAEGAVHHLPAEAREVFDVSGAGDTVVATVAAALAGGLPLADCARLANVAAGIVVGKVGTAVAYAAEVAAALRHHDLASGEAKVTALEAAADTVAAWRRKGLKVGFTNGCFDLLHPGHVSLVRQARAACDRLIVGLNSDASVGRLKGPARPVQGETARATVLASLAAVDMVVIFGEDTPLRLIETLRPDVLVKGADYSVETVVGADLVLGWGGRVVLAELSPGHSTTATIGRMAR